MTNAFPYTLHQLALCFGGTVSSRKPDRRTYYQWRLYGEAAIDLVKKLKPFLWEKLPQAELLLTIRSEAPGAKRDGLIRQLSSMKQIDYKD